MKYGRFSMRSMLVAVAIVSLFLGYAEWRRHRILSEVEVLESQGFVLLWNDPWTHWLWPVVPKKAACEYFSTPDGKWRFGANVYPAAEEDAINAHYARGTDRLKALGVEFVRLDREGSVGNSGTSTDRGK